MGKVSLQQYTDPNNAQSSRAFTEQWRDFKPSQYGQ